ncbi:hypothetical protein GCM10010345_48790 [Streptomyces canarius]|uniref:Uncharacterized protein n=1 Tax=Streptomyces canarius TaxID=285453 RepID=A0ABQ3CQV4_9ACTN|nr:hypothetical protein GCM10010345_48790 [Streptomyces canarius]
MSVAGVVFGRLRVWMPQWESAAGTVLGHLRTRMPQQESAGGAGARQTPSEDGRSTAAR